MTPHRLGCLTLIAALALMLSACMATPIPLPLTDLGAGLVDAGMAYDNVGLDMAPAVKDDGPGQPFPDSGGAMDASNGEGGITEGGPGEGGITEGGPGEGGITEGGPGEGGPGEGGPGEGGVADLASD